MNRFPLMLATFGAIAVLAVPAAAAVNTRQLNQQRNIDAGLRSGKLTRNEYNTLKAEQEQIRRHQAHYGRDGYSKREKAEIHAQQDAADRHIDRLKANSRRG